MWSRVGNTLSALTIRGRCLVAAGTAAVGCGLALDERELLRVGAFVMMLPLLALLLSSHGHRGLSAQREVVPDRTPVGSPATVRLHVRRRGHLAAASFVLEDGVPHALGKRPRFLLGAVGRRSSAALEYSVWPALRGIHRIGPASIAVSDPFGLSEFERALTERSHLIAVPQVVRLAGFPTASGLGSGEDGSAALRTGQGEDDTTVRQYRHGDDMRRVHWKTTARRDELMVRVEERPWQGGITVLLDRRSAAHRGSGAKSSLEWAVSAVASICLHLHRHGRSVRVMTEDGEVLAGGQDQRDGSRDDNAVLEALATVSPSAQRDLLWGSDPGDGRELVAVLGATTPSGVGELARLRPHGTLSVAVLLDVRAWEAGDSGLAPQGSAERLHAAGWRAAIAEGPDASMATVWTDLCRASGVTHGTGAA